MNHSTRVHRVRGLALVAVAAMLLVGPLPASEAALTRWNTIGSAWAYGGSSRLLDGTNNGTDAHQARVSLETITALDPRRVRLVVAGGEVEYVEYVNWGIGCIDRRGNAWSADGWRTAPALPLKLTIFHAGNEGRVQACRVSVWVSAVPQEQPYQLQVKVQARYAGT